MKSLLKLVILIVVLGLLWQWVKDKRKAEFINNLPEANKEANESTTLLDSVSQELIPGTVISVPLIAPGNFELNEAYLPQLAANYSLLFDSLQILRLSFSQVAQTSLPEIKAATVIQLLAYHDSLPDKREQYESAITFIGLILHDKQEVNFFVKEYLMDNDQWLKYIRKLHFLLMEQPQHKVLNEAYLALLNPADTEQTLDYLKQVQFLERSYYDDYYSVNRQVLDRFNEPVLRALLDKVDDYSWLAAYPERDAEQGILKILKSR